MADTKDKSDDTQPKAEARSQDPLAGAKDDPNRIQSAPETPLPGVASLAKMAGVKEPADPTTAPADQTQVVVINGQEAAKTDPNSVALGPGGSLLPPGGEVAGGNIKKVLDPPPDPSTLNQPLTKERAFLLSPVGRKLMPYISRPPAELGILGPGDTVKGHMLLLNVMTGEKTRGMDGHRINDGELYVNLRNLPEALSTGDTIEKLLDAV